MRKKIIFLAVAVVFVTGSLVFVFSHTGLSAAFSGPSNSAGSGSGSLSVDAAGNLSVGTTTLPGTTRLYVVGTTTNSSYFSFRAMDKANNPLFVVRNDGKVGIGLATFTATSTFRVAGAIESTSGGFIFPDGSVQISAAASTSTSAGYVTPGTFNSVANTGGAYTFPATLAVSTTLAVGTTTQPTGGVAYFNGNVGIGTKTPSYPLHVIGNGTAIGVTDGSVTSRFFSANSTGQGYVGTVTNNPFVIRTNDVDRITVATSGLITVANRITGLSTPTGSSDAATKDYVDARVSAAGVSFAGYSGAFSSGNLGGLKGGNGKCQAEFDGSHWASYDELMRLGSAYTWANDVWVRDALASVTYVSGSTYAVSLKDGYGPVTGNAAACYGWTSNDSGYSGTVMLGTPGAAGNLVLVACNLTRKLACVY